MREEGGDGGVEGCFGGGAVGVEEEAGAADLGREAVCWGWGCGRDGGGGGGRRGGLVGGAEVVVDWFAEVLGEGRGRRLV